MLHISSFGQALCQTGNDAMPYDKNAILTDFVHTDCPMCVKRYEDAMFNLTGIHSTSSVFNRTIHNHIEKGE